MDVERHAITPAARRTGFWPSIALASAQLRGRRVARVGRRQTGDPAVLTLLPADPSTAWATRGRAR